MYEHIFLNQQQKPMQLEYTLDNQHLIYTIVSCVYSKRYWYNLYLDYILYGKESTVLYTEQYYCIAQRLHYQHRKIFPT